MATREDSVGAGGCGSGTKLDREAGHGWTHLLAETDTSLLLITWLHLTICN